MKNQLYVLFFVDRRSRQKMYLWSCGSAMAFGLASMATGSPVDESVAGAALATLVILCTLTFVYCSRSGFSRAPKVDHGAVPHDLPARRTAIAGAVLSLSVALGLSTRNIEAAVIDRRLRSLSQKPDPKLLKVASSLLSSANSEGFVLSARPVQELVRRRLMLEDVLTAVKENIDREATTRGIRLPVWGLRLWKNTAIGQVQITGISGEGVNLTSFRVEGEAGSLVPPDMVAFLAPIGSRLEFPVMPGAGLIRIEGNQGHTSIPLDDLHCKNVIFTNCILVYSGKPVRFENVGFFNSTFEFSANLACQELAEKILNSSALTTSL